MKKLECAQRKIAKAYAISKQIQLNVISVMRVIAQTALINFMKEIAIRMV